MGRRSWLMTLGFFFLFLGAAGLVMAFLATLVTAVAFGVLLVLGGTAQTFHAFSVGPWRERGSYLLIGVLYLAGGFLIVLNPLSASAFAIFLAVVLLVVGACRIAVAVRNRGERRWLWPLVTGNLSMLLGIMFLLQWPLAGVWSVGLLLSLEMIFHGGGFLALPLAEKGRGTR